MSKKELENFSRQVVEIMPLMVREFAKREDNHLTQGMISCPQMVTLHFVTDHGRVMMSEISKVLSIKTSSASVLVDRLVRAKLLSREQDRRDRRIVWIRSTDKGRKVVSQIMRQKRESIQHVFGPLSPKERRQYLSVLQKVKANLLKGAFGAILLCLVLPIGPASAFDWPFFHSKSTDKKASATTPAASAVSKGLTLEQAYQLALKKSESVAMTAQEIDQAQARFYRAFNYFLPSVHFLMERYEQDPLSFGGEGVSGDSSRKVFRDNRFTFTQPLFSGFKEFAALKASGADKEEQRLRLRRAKELLFSDVMDAFYSVIQSERDVEALYGVHRAMSGRIRDLDQRIQIGRSRESEKQTSVSDLKLVEADLVDAQNALKTSRNLLEFYIGRSLGEDGLADMPLPEESQVLDTLLSKASRRSDVQAEQKALAVAEQGVTVAQADLFPTISAQGNYYTHREGFRSGSDWDVTLKLDVPVFEVGTTLGDIKSAAATRQAQELKAAEAQRLAELDARNAYDDFEAARRSEKALLAASEASKKNYGILQDEYGHNLVNNLDVLDALRRSEETQLRYNAAYSKAQKNYWKLKVATGEVLNDAV